jgi:hypothetical protein
MAKITVSEAISWQKIIQTRHGELLALRNASAVRVQSEYNGLITSTEPLHDSKKLDRRITLLARELRLLDAAIKKSNATTVLGGYEQDDGVLGELEDTTK